MINYKTKDKGMTYTYNNNIFIINHDYFMVTDFNIVERNNNTYIDMNISNGIISTTISPFYDPYIDIEIGSIIKLAYIVDPDNYIRAHGYELCIDEDIIESFKNKDIKQTKFIKEDTNVEGLLSRVNYYLNLIEDTNIRILVDNILNTYHNELITYPAAVSVHHNIKGGLLLHLVNVTRQALDIEKNYTDINRDLVIAGALLHDIGKVKEYTIDGNISDEGKYIDHITAASNIIYSSNKDLLDKRTLDRLLHIIISHHGKTEWGSPKVPVNKEAFIVHMADYIDTNMYIYHEAYRKVQCGESAYNKYRETYIVNDNIDVSKNYSEK